MDRYGLLHIGKTGGTAANTVLKANNKLRIGEFVRCYLHKVSLQQVAEEDLCERLMFFIREPVARYISAFNSRLRKGYPRHDADWSPREQIAFKHFKTPNQLAEGLSSDDSSTRQAAKKAMRGIRHLRLSYTHYLTSVELLEQQKERIFFIGATESFDSDFALLRRLLSVSPDIELPQDDRGAHRTPEGYETTVSELGRRNLEGFLKSDYAIYDWCVDRRKHLIAARTENFA